MLSALVPVRSTRAKTIVYALEPVGGWQEVGKMMSSFEVIKSHSLYQQKTAGTQLPIMTRSEARSIISQIRHFYIEDGIGFAGIRGSWLKHRCVIYCEDARNWPQTEISGRNLWPKSVVLALNIALLITHFYLIESGFPPALEG